MNFSFNFAPFWDGSRTRGGYVFGVFLLFTTILSSNLLAADLPLELALTAESELIWKTQQEENPERSARARRLRKTIWHPNELFTSGDTSRNAVSELTQELEYWHRYIVPEVIETKAQADLMLNDLKKSLVKTVEEKSVQNPVFLLHECERANCKLTRAKNPKPRAVFENNVVRSIQIQSKSLQSPVNVVSFGSGGMFQDLIVASKAFESGVREINYFLIDSSYKRMIECWRNPTKECETSFLVDKQFQQFLTWFKDAYSERSFRVFVFSSLNDYILSVETHSWQKADLLVSIDMDFWFSETIRVMQSLFGYNERSVVGNECGILENDLLARVLKPTGLSIFLDKGRELSPLDRRGATDLSQQSFYLFRRSHQSCERKNFQLQSYFDDILDQDTLTRAGKGLVLGSFAGWAIYKTVESFFSSR